MTTIKKLFLILVVALLGLIIYMNKDKLFYLFRSFLTQKNDVVIKEANEYKRNYTYIRFKSTESFTPRNENNLLNIYYNILNNGWDSFTFYCPTEYKNCLEDVSKISNNEETISNINGYVNPFNAFSSINTSISSYREIYVTVEKKYTDAEIAAINKKLNDIEKELGFSYINTKENKLKAFHDYLIKNTSYDEKFALTKDSDYNPNKANGALINGFAVCSGYSDAMALMLDRLGIQNIIISSEQHAWNLVYLNDSWLHIDSTWNDAGSDNYDPPFYLVNTQKLLEIDKEAHEFNQDFFLEAR